MGLFGWGKKKKKKNSKFIPQTRFDSYFYDLYTRIGVDTTDNYFLHFKQDLEPLYLEKLILKAYNSLENEKDRQKFDEFVKEWDDQGGTEEEKMEEMIDFVEKMNPHFEDEIKAMETEFADEYLQIFEEEHGGSFADCEECREHSSHCVCCRNNEQEVEEDDGDCDDSSDDCDDSSDD